MQAILEEKITNSLTDKTNAALRQYLWNKARIKVIPKINVLGLDA